MILCLQNYSTQRMDYFEYKHSFRQLDCCEEMDAMRTMNRFPCCDPISAKDISVKHHALFGKLSFKLPLDQTAPGSVRTRVIMGVAMMFDTGILQGVRELLCVRGVTVAEERLAELERRVKRLQTGIVIGIAGVVSATIAGVISLVE